MVSKPHRTVTRVADILEQVADHPDGLTLSELVRDSGIAKSSMHSLVQGLLAVGFLSDQGGRYFPGGRIELLVKSLHRTSVKAIAYESLLKLSEDTGETAHLGIRSGDSVVFIDEVASSNPIRYVAKLYERRSLVETAAGKIFLADSDESSIRIVLASQGISDPALVSRFLDEIRQVREEGVAYNREESIPGVCAVAAGVRDESSTVVASISVAGPTARVSGALDRFAGDVLEMARSMSQSLKG